MTNLINSILSLLKSITIDRVILLVLGISSLIGIFDFAGFLPHRIRNFIRLNRADDTLRLLQELGVDVERYKRSNRKLHYPHNLSEESLKNATNEALQQYTIKRKVSVGRRRRTELPYYIDLMGATCDQANAAYFANLLSNYWHSEITNGTTIPHFEFDFVVTPKDGSPILGYEFAKLINKPLVLHESKNRFSGFENDMRTVFDCEHVPEKGSTALIVDDSTTGGTMACQVIDDLRKYGYIVHTCLVVFEPQAKDARSRLKDKQVDLISITKTHDIKKQSFQHSRGQIKKEKRGNGDYLKVVFGNAERIFINFQIGCSCGCKYCYLTKLPEYIEPNEKKHSVEEVYDLVLKTPGFQKGKDGTILSFGCYSECLCDETRELTFSLMCKLAELGNPMQLSTKMKINLEEILKVDNSLSYENQLSVYISLPTITHASEYEPRASNPADRISILEHGSELKNIKFVLYIRPVIDTVTIHDIALYGNLMKQNNIPCIVGDYFIKNDPIVGTSINNAIVGEGHLVETEPKDLQSIIEELKKYGNVYRHSTEYVLEVNK